MQDGKDGHWSQTGTLPPTSRRPNSQSMGSRTSQFHLSQSSAAHQGQRPPGTDQKALERTGCRDEQGIKSLRQLSSAFHCLTVRTLQTKSPRLDCCRRERNDHQASQRQKSIKNCIGALSHALIVRPLTLKFVLNALINECVRSGVVFVCVLFFGTRLFILGHSTFGDWDEAKFCFLLT